MAVLISVLPTLINYNVLLPQLEFSPRTSTNAGIEIVALESIYARMPYADHSPFQLHRLKFHSLVYIHEGKGSHFIDFHRYPFQAGSFI